MRFVIVGAGALGSILAAHLVRSGEEVLLLARGERARYLQKNGITLCGLDQFNVTCPIVTDPKAIHSTDVLVIAVKTYDMVATLASLRHIDAKTVLSLQNGVLKDEQLLTTFGQKTVGTAASFSGEILPDGLALFTLNLCVYIGELPQGVSERVHQIVQAISRAGIKATATPNIRGIEWSKFVNWIGAMALSVLTRMKTHQFFLDPDTAKIGVQLMRETAAIAIQQGIELEDQPFMVRTISRVTESEAIETLHQLGKKLKDLSPIHRMSILVDLQRGRSLEVEETLGYVVSRATALNLSVPTAEMCYRLIRGINRSQQ